MANQIPLKALFDENGNVTSLGQFTPTDTVSVADGGTFNGDTSGSYTLILRGDSATEYVGLMADDAPWAMHYKGAIVNPVNTLGYTVLSIQALNDKIEKLEQELSEVRNVN